MRCDCSERWLAVSLLLVSASYDVIVIGAGPAGSATAHYAAARGLRVLLLDKSTFPRDKTCGDGLTPRAVRMLADMGVLEALRAVGYEVRRFAVFAPRGHATAAPIPHADPMLPPALVVPRRILDDHLRQRATASGAEFVAPAHVVALEREQDSVVITAEHNGRRLHYRAAMAVIATGASTRLLLQAGVLRTQPKVMVASRAYFERVRDLSDVWMLRFDHAPMPGYGWVFPIAPDSANIGVGYFKEDRHTSAHRAFERFVQAPPLRAMLREARQIEAAKGYPLRDDFLTAPTWAERVLVVGEAAGLVNPLTGEGIDYALESGCIAAQHAHTMISSGDFSPAAHHAYDQALRARFQALFEFCWTVRRWAMRPWVLDVLVALANRRTDLRTKLAQVVLGGVPIRGRLTLGRAVRALMRAR